MPVHDPVMTREVLAYLAPERGGVFVDAVRASIAIDDPETTGEFLDTLKALENAVAD